MQNNTNFTNFYRLGDQHQPLVFRFNGDELPLLLARALRGQAKGSIVWVDGDSEAVIYPDEIQIALQPGMLLIQLLLETDQTGRATLINPFFIGKSASTAALIATTEENPRGHPLLVSRWGTIAQDILWNSLLRIGQERLDTRLVQSNLLLVGLFTDGKQLAYIVSPPVIASDINDYFGVLRDANNGEIPTDIQPDPVELFPEEPPPLIRRLVLVDASTGKAIKGYDDLQDDVVLELHELPQGGISIRAETYPEEVGSVVFRLSPGDYQQVQNQLPYMLAADVGGAVHPWYPEVGAYVLKVTPYHDGDGRGNAGEAQTIHLRFIESIPMSISKFSLLDATNSAVLIDGLANKLTLNLAELPTRKLAVVAYTEPEQVGSVVFGLNNNPAFHIDNRSPYALFGDNNGIYEAWEPKGEDYTISATPYRDQDGRGRAGSTATIRLRVIDKVKYAVTGLTLIDADKDQPIAQYDPIPNQATIDLRQLPTRNLTVRANTYPDQVGSVAFDMNGRRVKVENLFPYALFGDDHGDFFGKVFELDKYTIQATPYTESEAHGEAGESYTVQFTVIDSLPAMAIVSFTLIDAAKDEPVSGYDPIPEGSVISLGQLKRQKFNIRANVQGDHIQSVQFYLNDRSFEPDNGTPFSLYGDHRGKFDGEKLEIMTYNLLATPYSEPNGGGQAGVSGKLRFHVTK